MIQNRELKQQAADRLTSSQQEKKIVLFYAGGLCIISVISMLLDLLITSLTPQAGGLSTIGTRSFLSALSGILPVIGFLLSMCLGFGYMGGMVRISRGQYASPNALRTGFERFWPLFRLTVLKGLIVFGCSIGASYLTAIIFSFTPFANQFLMVVEPMMGGSLLNEGTLVLNEEVLDALYSASVPILIIFLLVLAVFVIPMLYHLRMTDYVLYDHPEAGALYAIRESRKMMRNHRFAIFKLDFSFWWFYLALTVCYGINYGTVLLSLIGVTLPIPAEIASVVFFLLSAAAEFALNYFLRNKMEVTYALAYNALKPQEQSGGAVLGNILVL